MKLPPRIETFGGEKPPEPERADICAWVEWQVAHGGTVMAIIRVAKELAKRVAELEAR